MSERKYYLKSFKCNKKNCRCRKEKAYKHGPYIYEKIVLPDGRIMQRYIGEFQEVAKRNWL
jgi:hypothetical protein